MKISKTFRLSEEAVAELEKQTNATQFLEDLILTTDERKFHVVPLHQLEALLEPLLDLQNVPPMTQLQEPNYSSVLRPSATQIDSLGRVTPFTAEPVMVEVPVTRNDITTEIARLEAEKDDKLEYCQDHKEQNKITLDYKQQTDKLWAQFHALNKGKE